MKKIRENLEGTVELKDGVLFVGIFLCFDFNWLLNDSNVRQFLKEVGKTPDEEVDLLVLSTLCQPVELLGDYLMKI